MKHHGLTIRRGFVCRNPVLGGILRHFSTVLFWIQSVVKQNNWEMICSRTWSLQTRLVLRIWILDLWLNTFYVSLISFSVYKTLWINRKCSDFFPIQNKEYFRCVHAWQHLKIIFWLPFEHRAIPVFQPKWFEICNLSTIKMCTARHCCKVEHEWLWSCNVIIR